MTSKILFNIGGAVFLCGLVAPANAQDLRRPQSTVAVDSIGKRDINAGGSHLTPSLEDEIRLGRQLSKEVELNVKLNNDPALLTLVDRVGQTLARNSDVRIPVVVRVMEREDINVITLPGGYVYLTMGLIMMSSSEAELASALAHGIAHVAARHAVEQASRTPSLVALPVPASVSVGGIAGLANNTAAIPSSLRMASRGSVEEADWLGLQYLYKAGYDPNTFVSVLQKIEARSPAAKSPRSIFQTHPPISDRVKKFEINRGFLPPRDSHIVTTTEFDEVHSRLQ